MSKKSIDIANKVFGRLIVIERAGRSRKGDVLWRCLCKCGNVVLVTYSSLNTGNTRSCGCLQKEILVNNNRLRKLSLVGKKVGRLLVIKESSEKSRCGHYKWLCRCDCGAELLVSGTSLASGKTKSCGCINKERLTGGGEMHIGWKGGVIKYDLALFDTYAPKLIRYEKVRKNISGLLEVKCTYCGKWFFPKRSAVKNRIKSINNIDAENRLYCSIGCKKACPIFGQQKYPKGFKLATSREVQPQLRQMVFERDNYTCQKCGETNAALHCHHIDPVAQNPIESADLDNCLTLCKNCHKEIHKLENCSYSELRCK